MVVVGIIGTVLPALPGVPLVFAGLFLAAWADGFDKVGWAPLLVPVSYTHLDVNKRPRLPVVIDAIAGLRGENREVIAAATTENAERLFKFTA